MAESNPLVNLRHDELDYATTQPASYARHLLKSGWKPADDRSAALLDLPLPSESAPRKSRARSAARGTGSAHPPSNSNSTTSDDKKEND